MMGAYAQKLYIITFGPLEILPYCGKVSINLKILDVGWKWKRWI